MLKDKRGFEITAENVIGIVLALLVIFIIAPKAFGFAQTFLFGTSDKTAQAQSQIEDLVLELDALKNSEMNYELMIPYNWFLIKFDKNNPDIPEECLGKNCLCICPAKKFVLIPMGFNCNKGACKPVEKEVKMEVSIKIPYDITLKVNENIEITAGEKSKVTEKSIVELSEEQKKEYISLDSLLKENYPTFGKLNLGSCIIQAEADFKVPKEVIISVALHESNRGTSGLAIGKSPIDDTYAYNLFGRKGVGTSGVSQWYTSECLKQGLTGKDIVGSCEEREECRDYSCNEGQSCYCVIAKFRAYNNHCDSIRDFANLIVTSDRYKESLQYKDDIEKMIDAILNGGYATDPAWAKQVFEIAQSVQKEEIGTA